MTTSITREDWLHALDEAGVKPVDDRDATTIAEFAELTGLTIWMAAYRLRKFVAAGKAIRTSKRGPDSFGRIKQLAAYRLIEKPKTAAPSRKTSKRKP